MNRLKKLLSIILIGVILISNSSIVVYAEDISYKTFLQTDERWGNYVYAGKSTIKNTGCMITAISILMAYANTDLRNINDWNPKIASQKFQFTESGSIYWNSVKNADKTFTLSNGKKAYEGSKLSDDSAKGKVKGYLDEGKYVIICTKGLYTSNSHYSPIVGWDEENEEPLVWDVASGKYSDWNSWSKKGITEIIVYESTLRKSYDVLGVSKESAYEGGPNEEEVNRIYNMISEEDVLDIPRDFVFGVDDIELPNELSLTDIERVHMEDIKMDINTRKSSWFDMLKVIVTIAGLLCIIYGILLGVVYLFDYSNTFIEISLLGVLTLGKFRVWDDSYGVSKGYNSSDKKYYCDISNIIKRIALLILIGLLLIGGNIFRLISIIFEFIIRFISNII